MTSKLFQFLKFIQWKLPFLFLSSSISYNVYLVRFILVTEISLTKKLTSNFYEIQNQVQVLTAVLYFWYVLSFFTLYYLLRTNLFKHTKVHFEPEDSRINWENGKWKLCALCDNQGPRPNNTMHCKKCRACHFDLDHHCVWTDNCISKENMRYFVRFLTMASGLVCMAIILTVYFKNFGKWYWRCSYKLVIFKSERLIRTTCASWLVVDLSGALCGLFRVFSGVFRGFSGAF